jgi:hypothetical protein
MAKSGEVIGTGGNQIINFINLIFWSDRELEQTWEGIKWMDSVHEGSPWECPQSSNYPILI